MCAIRAKTKDQPTHIHIHITHGEGEQPFYLILSAIHEYVLFYVCWVIFRWWLFFVCFVNHFWTVFFFQRTTFMRTMFSTEILGVFFWANSNSNQTDCKLLAFLYCSFLFILSEQKRWRTCDVLFDDENVLYMASLGTIIARFIFDDSDNCQLLFSFFWICITNCWIVLAIKWDGMEFSGNDCTMGFVCYFTIFALFFDCNSLIQPGS